LRTLLLDAKQCNDVQIHVLRNLDKLEWLGLSGPQITDVSVPVLIQLSQLKSLHLHSTALSEVALAQLQRDLKDCVVRY
jgi:Leucine-rich repeat (LRR) protein